MKRVVYILLIFIILLTALLSFLLNSNAGLHSLLFAAKHLAPGQLTYQGATGTLLSPLGIKTLRYEDDQQVLILNEVFLKWSPLALRKKQFLLQKITARSVQFTSKSAHKSQKVASPTPLLSWPDLALQVRLMDFHIQSFDFNDIHIGDIKADFALTNTDWKLNRLSAVYDKTTYQLHGNIAPTPPQQSNFILTAETHAKHDVKIKGQLHLQGDAKKYYWSAKFQHPYPILIKGHLDNLSRLDTTIVSPKLAYQLKSNQNFSLQDIAIRIHGNYPDFTIQANANQLSPIDATVKIIAKSNLKTLQMQTKINSPNGYITNTIDAGLEGNRYLKTNLHAKNVDLTALDIPYFINNLDAHYSLADSKGGRGNITLKSHSNGVPITMSAGLNDKKFHARIQQNKNRINLNGATPFPINISIDIPQPSTLNPALKGLTSSISGTVVLQKNNQGRANITLSKGQWQNQEDTASAPFQFQGGDLKMQLTPRGLSAEGRVTIDAFKTVLMRLKLPSYTLKSPANPLQVVQGQMHLTINDLSFLKELSPLVASAHGAIISQLSVNGTFARPKIDGHIRIKQAGVASTSMGITFDPMNASLSTSNGKWQLSGTLGSNKSTLNLQGKGTFYPTIGGDITIKGQEFLLVNNTEYVIYLTPDVHIQLTPTLTRIRGNIIVPHAEIKPQTFSSSVSLSSDVVFANDKSHQSESSIETDITVRMGDKVQLDIKGLTALIKGEIQIKNESSGPFNANGQLSIMDGKYTAYGQDLTISRGELLFSGGQISNPGIDVRAVRNFSSNNTTFRGSNRFFDFGSSNIQTIRFSNQTTVGIQISGRVAEPNIELFSEPANLSQADILSMMILGRPASQASDAGGQILLAAISSMDLGDGSKGTQLLSQLQSALGLSFDVQNNSSYDQQNNKVSESRSLAVSKSFSNRLSLSYNMGLSNFNSNGLTLKYLLNRFFNVQVTASTEGSGIDFVYSHQQDNE